MIARTRGREVFRTVSEEALPVIPIAIDVQCDGALDEQVDRARVIGQQHLFGNSKTAALQARAREALGQRVAVSARRGDEAAKRRRQPRR